MKKFELQYIDDEVKNISVLKIYVLKKDIKKLICTLYNKQAISLYREWIYIYFQYGIDHRNDSIEKFLKYHLPEQIREWFNKKYQKVKLKK